MLIVPNSANSLFTHSTLVRVPWTLIMMWIRHQANNTTQNSEWIDLHVCHFRCDIFLSQGHESVVFFINIQVLDETLLDKVLEINSFIDQILYVMILDQRFTIGHNDVRSDKPSSITSDVDCSVVVVDEYAHKLIDLASTSQHSQVVGELDLVEMNTNRATIQDDQVSLAGMQLITTQHPGIFHSQVDAQSDQWLLWLFCGDMSG